ncbi:hypothetical protein SLEP1_g5320 [Rubroshorea leprosula]|uniref:Inositol polyphosphate-related phosphatase domain-containing protein n=2 Tax=Rubroshorea leprosula TaxID=152421 RepID=A0AAV5I1E1_9ROSI|nr:hypothetical protein SLEP1_g5320 [Rubroshorea leprosula]
MKQDMKNQNLIRKIFTMKGGKNGNRQSEESFDSSGARSDSAIQSLFFRGTTGPTLSQNFQSFRVFVATWNVGGKSPPSDLNLDDILPDHNQSDIYVLGFQEIVPLNAGNVLVIEDNEPAGKWLALINQSLNKQQTAGRGIKSTASLGGPLFFQRQSLRKISEAFRTESKRRLKSCNCASELEKKYSKEFCCPRPQSNINEGELSSEEDEDGSSNISTNQMKYGLVASKQMVGIFVTIWMRRELIQHVSHLRIFCFSRGIMGCLGNKGCIAVSMCFHQTSFCFVCSHLASGEKEGDELRRNSNVLEILRNTQFPRICRTSQTRVPEKILKHDRVIWLGDLNYRIALSYLETINFMQQNNWDALLHKDQLKIERDAGRVFKGWEEGKIFFAPTYKYSFNSDSYAGETIETKNKRRTPAWCDRILWHGNGIHQLHYIRVETRFSDHRPVYATFIVDVEVTEGRFGRKLSGTNI